MIETLDDIIEQFADKIGVYGAHDSACRSNRPCRVCFTSDLYDRLIAAFEIEQKLFPSSQAANGSRPTPQSPAETTTEERSSPEIRSSQLRRTPGLRLPKMDLSTP